MWNIDSDEYKAAIAFAVAQRTHVESEVNKTVYADIQYPMLIPVDSSANPFAKTITSFSEDQFGQAKWINGNADDIPMVGKGMSKTEQPIFMAGVGYGWGWEELMVAQSEGVPLNNDQAMIARRAYEEFVERVALAGDEEKGFIGLINNPALTAASAVTGNWDTASEDQIVADVNAGLMGVATETNYTSVPNTLLLSPAKMLVLASKRISGTTSTVMQFLQQNNAYTLQTGQPLMIRAVRGLDTAGTGDTSRMVAYRRDPMVLKLHIPMPHRFLPMWHAGPIRYEVPGVFRVAGVDIKRPAEVRYVDGI